MTNPQQYAYIGRDAAPPAGPDAVWWEAAEEVLAVAGPGFLSWLQTPEARALNAFVESGEEVTTHEIMRRLRGGGHEDVITALLDWKWLLEAPHRRPGGPQQPPA